jgi:RNA methyltransferase, TrmH family
VVSIARRIDYDPPEILAAPSEAPVVLLDDPRHRGNFGAVIRVAAAAQAAGVLSIGTLDPWHPVVVRGAAGLQFALPVARLGATPGAEGSQPAPTQRPALACSRRQGQLPAELAARSDRPLLAFDPAGDAFDPRRVPARAILAFGSERRGISPELLAGADRCLGLPMRQGVSSLNLASAVAAVLYALRLIARPSSGRAADAVR